LPAALLALDAEKLKERIGVAESAMLKRQQMLRNSENHSTKEVAIADGLASLPSPRKHTTGGKSLG
jgi:hypothetical protein